MLLSIVGSLRVMVIEPKQRAWHDKAYRIHRSVYRARSSGSPCSDPSLLVGFDLARVERHPVAEDDEIVDEVVEVAGALEGVNAGDPEGRHRFPLVAPAAGEHATAGTTTRAGGPRPGGRLGGLLHGSRALPSLQMSDSEASRRTGYPAPADAGGGGFASSRRQPQSRRTATTRGRGDKLRIARVLTSIVGRG